MSEFKIEAADHQIICGVDAPDSPTRAKCGVCFQPMAWFTDLGWCHVEGELPPAVTPENEADANLYSSPEA